MEGRQLKTVFTVTERNGKSYWTRVGFGSVNQDGSINLRLEAIPTNGMLQVREWEPPGENRGANNLMAVRPPRLPAEARPPRLPQQPAEA